jgi:acyl-coenzyme A synthetase/AMP-(fatty) acid ligase
LRQYYLVRIYVAHTYVYGYQREVSKLNREWISNRIASFGEVPAIVGGDDEVTFDEIKRSIYYWMQSFSQTASTCYQQVVIVNGKFNASTVGLIISLYIKKCAIVPLFDGDEEKIKEVIGLVQPDMVFNTTEAQAGMELPGPTVLAGTECPKHKLIGELFGRQESGLILYSSGSTGNPKAILLSLDRLLDRYINRHNLNTLNIAGFLLFDHIGGFDVMMQCLMTGNTLVTMNSRSPKDVCQAIEKHKVNVLPTTPTFLNMLLINRSYLEFDLSSLKVIAYGSEVMPKTTLHLLSTALPNVTLKQTYGMSELGVLPTESRSDDSPWIKIKKAKYKIQDGVLWINSDTAMLGYLNAEGTIDEAGWLCTGDMAEADGEYIRILGRKSSVINVAGEKVFPAEVEAHLLQAPFVKDSVVWGKKNPVTGHVVAATIFTDENIDTQIAKKSISDFCKTKLEPYKIPRYFEFVSDRYHSDRFKKIQVTEGSKTNG